MSFKILQEHQRKTPVTEEVQMEGGGALTGNPLAN